MRLLFLTLFLLSTPGFAAPRCQSVFASTARQSFAVNDIINAREVVPLEGEVYSLFNHTSRTWDSKGKTFDATKELNALMRENEVPVISMVEGFRNGEPVPKHFLRMSEIDIPVHSPFGSHRLSFSGLKTLVLSGGYFGYCLARATKDVILGLDKGSQHIQLHYVSEATYTTQGVVSRPRSAGDLVTLPEATLGSISLKEGTAHLGREGLLDYIKDQMINLRQGRLYVGRSYVPSHRLPPGGVTLRFYRNLELLDSVGEGSLKIDVHITDLSLLKQSNIMHP